MKHIAGQYYHIYNRGVEKRIIFSNDENYRFLLRRAREFITEYQITTIAYCLMPNHYHFLIREEVDANIGLFIQRLFNSYTQAFNRQEKRSGTLFEGRAKTRHIDNTSYLLHICRYIHLNPVIANLVQTPQDWEFSNYREFIGLRSEGIFDFSFVQEQFGNAQEYQKFVESDIQDAIQRKIAKYLFD